MNLNKTNMSSTNSSTIPLSCLSKVKRNKSMYRPQINKTDIHFIYDKSGSMGIGEISITAPQGLRDFVREQKEKNQKDGTETYLTITTFSCSHSVIPTFNNIDVRDAPEIKDEDIIPDGTTLLIDTIYECSMLQEDRCKNSETPLDKWTRILVVMTDGQDNRSYKFSARQLHDRIEKLRSENVTCLFLAANQDSIYTGNKFGFSPDQSLTYSAKGAPSALRAISGSVNAAQQSCGTYVPSFTPLQRELSQPIDNTLSDDEDNDNNNDKNIIMHPNSPPPPPHLQRMLTGNSTISYSM